jgi:hypothetical protein
LVCVVVVIVIALLSRPFWRYDAKAVLVAGEPAPTVHTMIEVIAADPEIVEARRPD